MCLENAMKLVDEAVIVDTGSTDKTKEIIKDFNNSNIKLIDYKWEDDFSKARNVSIEAATGDWILMLDADEKLLCDSLRLREILKNSELEAYRIPFYNIMSTSMILYSAVYVKFFRNNKGYKYSGRIHEQLNLTYDMQVGDNIIDENVCKIIHYGYLISEVQARNKSERNLKILKKQIKTEPNNPFVYYNIGASYEIAGNYEEALKNFFKCNKFAAKENPTGLTLYEIDMARRIGECLVKLEKYDECIEVLSNLLSDKLYSGFVDLEYIKGYCFYAKKNYQRAIECYHKCIEIGETKEFSSVFGMGSFKPKFMIAKCYVELKDEIKAINMFMESIFDSNNIMHEGIDEFRKYLIITNRIEVLNQLNKLVKK